MRRWALFVLVALGVSAATQYVRAEDGALNLPKTIVAGSAFSIPSTGSGKAVLFIAGPEQVIRRDIQLGDRTSFPSGTLFNAGRYVVAIVGESGSQTGTLDVVPANQPATLSFLAKPSRLPVGLHNGISGAVYVFDSFQNLMTAPTPVSFELTGNSGTSQSRTVSSRNGVAWTQMDSSTKEGADKFLARAGGISSARIIQQVPGDPCGLRMNARQTGSRLELQTDPVKDCSGNAVPDGTVITFTEAYNGTQSTVDVPLKRGIAKVEMPAYDGARISVATGVVLGNEIHWGKQ